MGDRTVGTSLLTSTAHHLRQEDTQTSPESALQYTPMLNGPGDGATGAAEAGPAESQLEMRATMQRMPKAIRNGKYSPNIPSVMAKRTPLRLLDLPLDILKEIVKEVTHTNDLTSLALCHSALHELAIPHIYSRFDIVWPDTLSSVEPRSGVDALTYGLATLVFGEEIFGEAPNQQQPTKMPICTHCGHPTSDVPALPSPETPPQPHQLTRTRRHGNNYAHYTRKFSLGNGPADWVQEYLISKEGGKMLGTLVALAVARMRNLETFVWDMPTGVLRDVWMALASLGERRDGHDCKLERIWIRWHDNAQIEISNVGSPLPLPPNVGLPPPNVTHHSGPTNSPLAAISSNSLPVGSALDCVEQPTFSILPPLKSLSVLDIDELAYLDEMSHLIGKSQSRLRELRVGVARHAQDRDWAIPWEGEAAQLTPNATSPTCAKGLKAKRLGGVLGVLVSKFHDLRPQQPPNADSPETGPALALGEDEQTLHQGIGTAELGDLGVIVTLAGGNIVHSEPDMPPTPSPATADTTEVSPSLEKHSSSNFVEDLPHSGPSGSEQSARADINGPMNNANESFSSGPEQTLPIRSVHWPVGMPENTNRKADGTTKCFPATSPEAHSQRQLSLEVLVLERVQLSVRVLQKALDWSKLTSLTILDCQYNDQLWKVLRRKFSPAEETVKQKPSPKSNRRSQAPCPEYSLKLRNLHTNTVSSSLISFLREALAPNSLEVLFLQESKAHPSNVTIDAIFRGPLRRHRASLKKVSIDSSEKGLDGNPVQNLRWRKWLFNRDMLAFICSGRMPKLKELGMAIEYRDWHFFLQRLPQMPQIRSIFIPFIADHAHGSNVDSRELALQIVDIVTLRPDVQLCYMGIGSKCFEILETSTKSDSRSDPDGYESSGDLDYSDDEEDDDREDAHDDIEVVTVHYDHEDTDDSDSRHEHSEIDDDYVENDKPLTRLKLREILFYDDKVAIFKARHGKL